MKRLLAGTVLVSLAATVCEPGHLLARQGLEVQDLSAGSIAIRAVQDTNALKHHSSPDQLAFRRMFAVQGDGGAALYRFSAAACSDADDGAQISSVAIPGCWLIEADHLTPQLFGAKGDGATDDAAAFAAAAKAAIRLRIPLVIPSRTYCEKATWTVASGLDVSAQKDAVIQNCGRVDVGINLPPGGYGKITLPSLGGFRTGLQLEGASLARIDISFIGHVGSAVRYTSRGGSILDSVVNVGQIFEAENGFVIHGEAASDVIQGNVLNANFVTTTANPFIFTGTICNEDGNTFHAQAVDITGDRGGGAAVSNMASPSANKPHANGTNIPRAAFIVDNWFGGDGFLPSAKGGPAQIFRGGFYELTFDVTSAFVPLGTNLMQSSSLVFASKVKTKLRGPSRAAFAALTKPSQSTFNQGNPISFDSFFVSATTSTSLPPNGFQDFYIYALFNDSFAQPFSARAADLNQALSLVGITDLSAQTDHMISFRLTNSTTQTLHAGSTKILAFNRE